MGASLGSSKSTPHYKKLMVFVDGTNFLCHLSKELDIKFEAAKPPFASLVIASTLIRTICERESGIILIRKYWFSSYKGNDEYQEKLAIELRSLGFEPVLFQKRGDREKGVDIGLAKEMLVNAFNQNFDLGLLVAGDEDYVGLIYEVKRYGQVIIGSFFRHGLSKKLNIAFDEYYNIIKSNSGYIQSKDFKDTVEGLRKFCNKDKTKSKG